MNNQLLAAASKIIPDPKILVNIVSRRVRKLCNGSRPMVAAPFGAGFMDIALQEIAEGKLSFRPSEKIEPAL